MSYESKNMHLSKIGRAKFNSCHSLIDTSLQANEVACTFRRNKDL